MFSTVTLSYVILAVFGGFSFVRLITDSKSSAFVTIFLNVIFGGTIYIILNICKVAIPFNFISASCITLLGVPGVILLAILKFVFKIF